MQFIIHLDCTINVQLSGDGNEHSSMRMTGNVCKSPVYLLPLASLNGSYKAGTHYA